MIRMGSFTGDICISALSAGPLTCYASRLFCSKLPSASSQTSCSGKILLIRRCSQSWQARRTTKIAQAIKTEADVVSPPALEDDTIEIEVKVEGMTCGHCTSRVEESLMALPGVRSARASLETGVVTVAAVAGDQLQAAAVQLPAVVEAIKGLGFGAEPYFPQEAE